MKSKKLYFKLSKKTIILFITVGVLVSINILLVVFKEKNSVIEKLNAAQIARDLSQQCNNSQPLTCFRLFFTEFARKHESNETLAVLDELVKINNTAKVCHTIAHSIALTEVEKNPSNWESLFATLPLDRCSYGFVHGIIEGRNRIDQDFKIDESTLSSICKNNQITKNDQGIIQGCAHALGHILLVQDEGNFEQARKTCQSIESDLQRYCFQGLFMENLLKDNLVEHGIAQLPEWNSQYLAEQKKFCNNYEDMEQAECWERLTIIISPITKLDNNESIRICLEAPMQIAKDQCIMEILGTNTVGQLKKGEQQQQVIPQNTCSYYKTSDQYTECVVKVVTNILLSSIQWKNAVNNFCRQQPPGVIDACFRRSNSIK